MLKAFMIGVMGLGAGAYIILNSDNSFPNNERHEFISRISFASNCDLNNKSFAIQNLRTGSIANIQHGEAFIRAARSDTLKVVMAPEYSATFRLNGVSTLADPNVSLFQDCNNRVTLDSIFESMNNQFSTK